MVAKANLFLIAIRHSDVHSYLVLITGKTLRLVASRDVKHDSTRDRERDEVVASGFLIRVHLHRQFKSVLFVKPVRPFCLAKRKIASDIQCSMLA